MKASIAFVLCVVFFVQIGNITAYDITKSDVYKKLDEDPSFQQLSDNAKKTVATMLNHLVYMLRDQNSSRALIQIANGFQQILTSQAGQDNLMNFMDLVGFVLKNKHASGILSLLCDEAITLITTPNGRSALKATITSTYKVMELPTVIPAAQSFLNNIDVYLNTLTDKEVAAGLGKLSRAINMFSTNSANQLDPNQVQLGKRVI